MRIIEVNQDEVAAEVAAAEAAGETQLHNDRLPDGRRRLTFVTSAEDPRQQAPVAAPAPDEQRRRQLTRKLVDGDLTLVEINELLRLERGP